jgi:hypothetical protein
MPDAKVLLVVLVIGVGYVAVKPVAHVINKAAHGIVHVVTFGKK